MTDTSPTPPNRPDPLPESADGSDEPAFEWMRPASAGTEKTDNGAGADRDAGAAPGRRAERRAAEAAAEAVPRQEPLDTSALQLRPPREEVDRRNAEREHAANTKPVLPRVMQVLLAVCFPVILLVLAVRAVASPLFLWSEYNRPGFPGDGYGFSTDDRMTYGSYAVDYLSNWAGPRYLGELVDRSGDPLFKDGEVSHMADVKLVILSAFGAGLLLILLSVIAVIYLRRRSSGGVRRGLFAGSVITVTLITSLAVLAVLGWEQFFTEFHRLFFASGTWTFSLQDTLIRLFPGQFWVDAGIVSGALVLLASLATLILTWPTRKRRGLPGREAAAGDAAKRRSATAASSDGTAGEPGGLRSRFRRSRTRKPAAAEGAADEPEGAAPPTPGTRAAAGPQPPGADNPSRGQASPV